MKNTVLFLTLAILFTLWVTSCIFDDEKSVDQRQDPGAESVNIGSAPLIMLSRSFLAE